MSLSYAEMQTRILQMLQDTGGSTYDPTELGMWVEDELKRMSRVSPHTVDVIFQVESRKGTDVTGTEDKLTDSVKNQFLTADATKEKRVHNIKDDTWAVITGQDSLSILSLSVDIMDANEQYEICNKRCNNQRQIFIGDMPLYLWIVSVEYPVGKERNFKMITREVLELEVEDSTIKDSDSTLSTLNKIDVLVRFAMPHVLSQLTDWVGTLSATESKGDTQIAITGMGDTEIIEVGEEFHLEDHSALYIIDTEKTTSATAVTDLSFYPPLEADLASTKAITFTKSTLLPQHEEILALKVTGRAMDSDKLRWLNATPVGGPAVWGRYRREVRDKLEEAEIALRSLVSPKSTKKYPRT